MTQETEQQKSKPICPHCGQELKNPVYYLGQSIKFTDNDGYTYNGYIVNIYDVNIPTARVFVQFGTKSFVFVDLSTLRTTDNIPDYVPSIQTIVLGNGNQLPMLPVSEEVIRVTKTLKDIEDEDSDNTIQDA